MTLSFAPRRLLYPVADAILGSYGRFRARSYDIRETVIVASSGRGGSTWMAEIVATLPGYAMQWEPFHLNNNPRSRERGFTWQNYIRPGTEAPLKQAYMEQILTGRDLSTRTTSTLAFDVQRMIQLRGFVVKMVNANMMLAWILEQFPVQAVLSIRHPCGVVASQMAHGSWQKLTKDAITIPEGLYDDYPEYEQIFASLEHPEEILAFEWALQAHVPLSTPSPHQWHFTTYEWMVSQGEEEVDRLFAALGKPAPPEAYTRLRTASSTTAAESNLSQGRDPLSGWQRRLTAEQVDRILAVTHRMGADYYSDGLLPEEGILSRPTVSSRGS